MPRKRRPSHPNPILTYKTRHDLTYRELAHRLGCSWDLARKLGARGRTVVSPAMAQRFHRRTRGELAYLDLMAWVGQRLRRPGRGRR
jgi:hypothetical protein